MKRKLIFSIIFFLIIAGIISAILLWPNTDGNQDYDYLLDQGIIAQVGSENIYLEDLNRLIVTSREDLANMTPERQKALEELVNESIALQEGAEADWIELENDFYNSKTKNYQLRQTSYDNVRKAFLDEETQLLKKYIESNKINLPVANPEDLTGSTRTIIPAIAQHTDYSAYSIVEALSVWFWNRDQGEFAQQNGLAAAQAEARTKLEAIRNEVSARKISLEEGLQLLISDQSLAHLDLNYQNNAYTLFFIPYDQEGNIVLQGQNLPTELLQFLEEASKGEVSELILRKDIPNADTGEVDALYSFFTASEIKHPLNDFDGWVHEQRNNYHITIYTK